MAATTPEDAAEAVRRALYDLDTALRDAEGMTIERTAGVLAILDRAGMERMGCAQLLAVQVGALRLAIGKQLRYKQQVVVDGVGVLEQTKSGRRYSWDSGSRLAHIIAAQVADELVADSDGVIVPRPPGALAAAVADALVQAGGLDNSSASWRSEPLKARGIDPSDHRSVASEGTPGVRWLD